RSAKFDLTLTLQEVGTTIQGRVEYATALFEDATVARYVGYLQELLRGMVAEAEAVVDRLPILPAAERAQVVEEWNATATAFPSECCVHELIEAQAAATPAAVAVVAEAATLCYAELN